MSNEIYFRGDMRTSSRVVSMLGGDSVMVDL